MNTIQAIQEIQKTSIKQNMKDALCLIASEFDCFMDLKREYGQKGLMKACWKNLGVKFIGMYSINSLEDLIKKAKENNLLA